ncbi:GNAT family protein [Acetomicrobium sp.]|uniref:GNAT family N-acetyltransferase n=1 Tax=Acetomicrobium sp. TaxID=1872099 RepID=UPI002FC5F418
MIIENEDITLRAIEESDLELLREMINDPEIESMTGGYSYPVSTYQQRKWFESLANGSNDLRLIIDIKEHGAIGTVMLTDIDWKNRTTQSHWKIANRIDVRCKGYGTRAVKALIKYAFNELNMHCVYCKVIEYNIASQKIVEKIGFKREGILRERIYKNGNYHNVIVWSILKDEFNE